MTPHPITPPPELVMQWSVVASTLSKAGKFDGDGRLDYISFIATKAAQWGADQELEACCELVRDNDGYDAGMALLAERRIHSLSLKQQALQAIGRFSSNAHTTADEMTADFELLRQVVEQLDG